MSGKFLDVLAESCIGIMPHHSSCRLNKRTQAERYGAQPFAPKVLLRCVRQIFYGPDALGGKLLLHGHKGLGQRLVVDRAVRKCFRALLLVHIGGAVISSKSAIIVGTAAICTVAEDLLGRMELSRAARVRNHDAVLVLFTVKIA